MVDFTALLYSYFNNWHQLAKNKVPTSFFSAKVAVFETDKQRIISASLKNNNLNNFSISKAKAPTT
ncbi:MAG: hypothetical protein CML05_09210 [Pseudozobellia sp.]|nr:hypothetical protein [Pseudozobellia sp.]|tara:strand:- start:738 stop:935 length:198 start_codon:yes stop_codon:yes gene_type:complete